MFYVIKKISYFADINYQNSYNLQRKHYLIHVFEIENVKFTRFSFLKVTYLQYATNFAFTRVGSFEFREVNIIL